MAFGGRPEEHGVGRAEAVAERLPGSALNIDPLEKATYNTNMKAIQVLFDEALLEELDATTDVRDNGRSAVLRQIARDFIRQRREQEIDAQYERAYAGVQDPLGKDFEGWEEEGVWPPE